MILPSLDERPSQTTVSSNSFLEALDFCSVIGVGLEQAETQRIVFAVVSRRSAYLSCLCIESQHDSCTRYNRRFAASLGRLFHLDKNEPLVVNLRFRRQAATAADG